MATSEGFKDFVLEQLARCAEEYLKGEYAFSTGKCLANIACISSIHAILT